jgi:hypothetical protein
MPSLNPPPLPRTLPEAPGAKAARTCGLLSIVFAVTCIGIPVTIVLGIIALVQQARAKRLASEFPQEYRMPTASGLVMGIVGLVLPFLLLPFVGILSAIAIPAFLSQKGRAINAEITSNLTHQMEVLTAEYQKGKEVGLDQSTIQASMEQILQGAQEHNPADPQAPAFRYAISIVSASSTEEAAQNAEAEATTTGEVVYVLAFPTDPQQPGYLAGAAMLKMPVNGSSVTSKAVSLE